ncbi:MAG: ribbon-helix-helix protein, CopG family [Prochloraceae cyanobacterium]
MTAQRRITIRLPESELKILEAYCDQTSRTKTDIIRDFIRGLGKKIEKSNQLENEK